MDNDRPWNNSAEGLLAPGGDHVCGPASQWAGDLSLPRDGTGLLTPQGWPFCCQPGQLAGCCFWYNAHDLDGPNNSQLLLWPDRSPNRNDAGQHPQLDLPRFVLGIRAGLDKTVAFGGNAGLLPVRLCMHISWSAYFVWYCPAHPIIAIARVGMPFGGDNELAGPNTLQATLGPPNFRPITRVLNNGSILSMNSAPAGPFFGRLLYDRPTATLSTWTNGTGFGTLIAALGPQSAKYLGGQAAVPQNTVVFYLAEALLYDHVLSPADDTLIVARMSAEWGLPLVGPHP